MSNQKQWKHFLSLVLICSFVLLSMPIKVFAADGSTTVYITKTGEKYHTSGCQYLKKSKISISLQDAVSSGYTACSKCHPPQLTETTPVTQTTPASIQQATGYTGAYAKYVTMFEERYENGLIDELLLEECYQFSDVIYYTDADLTVYATFTDEQDMADFSYYILLRTYDNMVYAKQHPEIFYTKEFNVDEYFLSSEDLWTSIGYDVNALYQHYVTATP